MTDARRTTVHALVTGLTLGSRNGRAVATLGLVGTDGTAYTLTTGARWARITPAGTFLALRATVEAAPAPGLPAVLVRARAAYARGGIVLPVRLVDLGRDLADLVGEGATDACLAVIVNDLRAENDLSPVPVEVVTEVREGFAVTAPGRWAYLRSCRALAALALGSA